MLVLLAGMFDLIEYKAQRLAQGVVSRREIEGGDLGVKKKDCSKLKISLEMINSGK
jgi:hypothetical protein